MNKRQAKLLAMVAKFADYTTKNIKLFDFHQSLTGKELKWFNENYSMSGDKDSNKKLNMDLEEFDNCRYAEFIRPQETATHNDPKQWNFHLEREAFDLAKEYNKNLILKVLENKTVMAIIGIIGLAGLAKIYDWIVDLIGFFN